MALIATGALAASVLGSTGTASASTESALVSASSGTLKLGFFGALTGPDAQLGINIEDGEKLALAQYMAKKPAVKVVLDPFDSQGDPSQANNGATKLIQDHDVAVIGPAFSGESAAADPIFEQAGVPNISASATNVQLAQNKWKYFHRVLADDSYQGKGDADYLVKHLHDKKIAVVDDNSTYGAGLATYVNKTIKADHGTVAVTDHLDPNGADYSSTVNKVIASKATAIFFGGYYDAAGRLINQLRKAGFKGAFMSGDGSEDQRIVTDAGGAPANGAFLSCACADETRNPAAKAFVSAYKKLAHQPPAIYSAEAYDATNFVLQAIKSGATTNSAINTYLATHSMKGVTKRIKFQKDGNISGGTIYIYKVEKGKVVQIGTTH